MSIGSQAALWAVLALITLIIEVTHRTFYLLIVCISFVLAMCGVLIFHSEISVQLGIVVISSLVGIPLAGKLRHRNGGLHFPADQGQTVKVIRSQNGRLRSFTAARNGTPSTQVRSLYQVGK